LQRKVGKSIILMASGSLQISYSFQHLTLRSFADLGCSTFLRTYNRRPFLLSEHLDRFLNTAKQMDMPCEYTKDQLERVIKQGIELNPHLSDVYIKMYLTGGLGPDAITPDPPTASFITMFLPAGSYPPECYTKGVKLITVEYERYIAVAKSLNYMAAVKSVQAARKQNAIDALFVSRDGRLLESTTQNFFAVIGNTLVTPEEDILLGITRKFVLDVAREHKNDLAKAAGAKDFKVEIAHLHRSQLEKGQIAEAFTTSTTREVTPVVEIDNHKIGKGTPGPVTKLLLQLFKEKTQRW